MKRMHLVHFFDIPATQLFWYISEHHNLNHLYPVASIRPLTSGEKYTNGKGSVRTLKIPLLPFTLKEEITEFEVDRLIEYRLTGLLSPIKNHKGTIIFSDLNNGRSRIDYMMEFEGRLPLSATTTDFILPRLIRRAMKRMAILAAK